MLILLVVVIVTGLLIFPALNFNTSFLEVAGSDNLLYMVPPLFITKDITKAAILSLKDRQFDPGIREADYILITGLLLYHYFPYKDNWCVAPEQVIDDNYKPDFIVSEISTAPSDYGQIYPYLNVEVKKPAIISWKKLLDDQLHKQCDNNSNNNARQNNGRLWAMGQRGFEICLFLFDIHKNVNLDNYTQFTAVNPWNFSADDFDHLDAKPFVEKINGVDQIIAVNWRLDNSDHHRYIHDMFIHILKSRA